MKALLKRIAVIVVALLVVIGTAAGLYVRSLVKSVPQLMLRNGALKAQGYYMGEFEFKMLSVIQYMNTGRYLQAVFTLHQISQELKTTRGLVKLPAKASAEQQLDSMLALQDPVTGAFMDHRYPYFTYWPPTANMVVELSRLANQAGRPLVLKYPLRFLDDIRTPEQLRAYLDSLLYLDERWAGMGKPPYVAGVSELAYFDDFEDRGVYQFSAEWKDELRRWFTETQDPTTGFWGARIGRPGDWRQDLDIGSTFHVLHLFVDEEGHDRDPRYPLRNVSALLQTTMKRLEAPFPTDPVEQHDWCLWRDQGPKMIVRLWPHLSDAEKEEARDVMRTQLVLTYQEFFRPDEGAFSLYSKAPADLDGLGSALSFLEVSGSFPGTREQSLIWGERASAVRDLGERRLAQWADATLPEMAGANSIRVYSTGFPASGASLGELQPVSIFYPNGAQVLDLIDLRGRVAQYLAKSPQVYGNWTGRDS
ncbi:MAG: hypothetical protein ACM3XM_17045, partial [Mycobacterium leprae]